MQWVPGIPGDLAFEHRTRGAVMTDADLRAAVLVEANLIQAVLTGADLYFRPCGRYFDGRSSVGTSKRSWRMVAGRTVHTACGTSAGRDPRQRSPMAAMKWWGWGDEGVSFTHEDKPALAPFLQRALDLDVTRVVSRPTAFDDLRVPEPSPELSAAL